MNYTTINHSGREVLIKVNVKQIMTGSKLSVTSLKQMLRQQLHIKQIYDIPVCHYRFDERCSFKLSFEVQPENICNQHMEWNLWLNQIGLQRIPTEFLTQQLPEGSAPSNLSER